MWLRPARPDVGRESNWLILDGTVQRGTGCGPSDIAGAEKALAAYLTEKHTVAATSGDARDPAVIPINDVLALYVRDMVARHARPAETAKRIQFLRAFWGGRRLSEVTGAECRIYVRSRTTSAAARRELEELRAAINHHRREGLHDKILSVVLPEKSLPRERWLTRDEAAKLILGAWRHREVQNFHLSDRYTRRHIARFALVALYTGSRAGVVCSASFKREAGRAWVDVDAGVLHRRPERATETKKRRPPVHMPDELVAHLRRWKANGQRYVVEWNGKPIERVSKAFAAACATAGLGFDVVPHTLRHTAATWMMMAGTDLWEAAGYLGMTVETLERNYGHHHPAHQAGARGSFRRMKRGGPMIAKDKGEQKSISTHRTALETPVNPISG